MADKINPDLKITPSHEPDDYPGDNPIPEIIIPLPPHPGGEARGFKDIFHASQKIERVNESIRAVIDGISAGINPVSIAESAVKIGIDVKNRGVNTVSLELIRRNFVKGLTAVQFNAPGIVTTLDSVNNELQGSVTQAELIASNKFFPELRTTDVVPLRDGVSITKHSSELDLSLNVGQLYSPIAPYDQDDGSILRDLNDAATGGEKPKDKKRLSDSFSIKKKILLSPKTSGTRVKGSSDRLGHGTFFKNGSNPSGQIPAGFNADLDDGSIITNNSQRHPHEIISDDEAYIPLSFTDLRPLPGDGFLRSVYFRPFNITLNEDFSPEWNKQTYYGRSDQVVTYGSTIRSVQLGFAVHAFHPEDVDIIYKKLKWLASLTYPEYDSEALLKAGPVCRMRVGDVIASSNRLGLPGVIDSLSINYSEKLWELEDSRKVLRGADVNVSFHVLHDALIGRTPTGNFGGIKQNITTDSQNVNIPRGTLGTLKDTSVGITRISSELIETPGSFRGFGNSNGKK